MKLEKTLVQKVQRHPRLAVAVIVAATVAWRAAGARHRRQQLLQHGTLRALRSVWAEVEDCLIHARIATAAARHGAKPIVLVHGWGISGSYFIPLAERLAADFPVYVPDLPGHGKSCTPAQPLDVRGLSHALAGWIKAMGLEQPVLIGHSLGCQVAVETALQHPEHVDRLVLLGLTPDPAARRPALQFWRFLRGSAHERPSLNFHLVKDYTRMGKRLLPEFQAMLEDPIEAKLPKLHVPVMLVRGKNDAIAPQRWLEQAAHLLGTAQAQVVVIPQRGHAVHYSAVEPLVHALRPFLWRSGKPD